MSDGRTEIALFPGGYTTRGLPSEIRGHRDLLALKAVESGRAIQVMRPGTVWRDEHPHLETTVFGVGSHTLVEMVRRKLVAAPKRDGQLRLTKLGREVLACDPSPNKEGDR